MNGVKASRFPLLVTRIITTMGQTRAFSEDEETKLLSVFNLTQPQLTTLIEASTYIFEQATYFTVSANKLVNQLMAASVADAQAQAFGQVWAEHSEAYVKQVKSRLIGAPKVLDNVTWRLHMTLGNQSEAKSTNLTGFFNFATTEVDGSDADSVTVGLTQAQVEKLFEQLQTVQNQLDSLS